jgi:hypothetical protein
MNILYGLYKKTNVIFDLLAGKYFLGDCLRKQGEGEKKG